MGMFFKKDIDRMMWQVVIEKYYEDIEDEKFFGNITVDINETVVMIIGVTNENVRHINTIMDVESHPTYVMHKMYKDYINMEEICCNIKNPQLKDIAEELDIRFDLDYQYTRIYMLKRGDSGNLMINKYWHYDLDFMNIK